MEAKMAIIKHPLTRDNINLFEHNVNSELATLEGVNYIGREWIEFRNIDHDLQNNPWRVKGQNSANAAELAISFAEGIDTRCDLPILYKLPVPKTDSNGNVRTHGMVGGNHRLPILKALGYKGYFFEVVELGADGVGYLTSQTLAAMRDNHSKPRAAADNEDVARAVQAVVVAKEIGNTEDEIRAFVKKCCPYFSNSRIGTITAIVCSRTSPATSFVNWNAMTKEDFADTMQKKFKHVAHGKIDPRKGKHGFAMLDKGYFIKGIYHAMKKFNEDGKESYFIGHVKSPNSQGTLAENRLSIVDNVETYKSMLIKVFNFYKKTGRFPFEVIGFLPQDDVNELDSINSGEILEFTKQELEILVQMNAAKAITNGLTAVIEGTDEEEEDYEDA
jgi:hypothetical protein